jgi:hypothetical protein
MVELDLAGGQIHAGLGLGPVGADWTSEVTHPPTGCRRAQYSRPCLARPTTPGRENSTTIWLFPRSTALFVFTHAKVELASAPFLYGLYASFWPASC